MSGTAEDEVEAFFSALWQGNAWWSSASPAAWAGWMAHLSEGLPITESIPFVMQPLRIYLIGAGNVAYMHMTALPTLPAEEQIELVVADPHPDALKAFLKAYPQARGFTDAYTMLAEPARERDIVIVASPPFTHCELACTALKTGRHVLCEKPLALNMAEALQMLETAREAGRVLACCSMRSTSTRIGQELRRLIQSGQLGDLYHLRFIESTPRLRPGIEQQPESTWFLDKSRSGGGVVMNLGPYDIAFLNELLQPERFEVVSAWMADPQAASCLPETAVADVEQHVGATLRFHRSGSAPVFVTYERSSCTHGAYLENMELVGTLGAARWEWFLWREQSDLVHSFERQGQSIKEVSTFDVREEIGTMARPLNYLYGYLFDQPVPVLINERAVFNFACLQAIYACAQTGEPQSVSLSF